MAFSKVRLSKGRAGTPRSRPGSRGIRVWGALR